MILVFFMRHIDSLYPLVDALFGMINETGVFWWMNGDSYDSLIIMHIGAI